MYQTDMFGKKNELDYFFASQKLLGMLPFVQLSTSIIQLGGLCLGSSLVISFYNNIAYAMESDLADVKIESDSGVVNLELDNVRKGHTSTSKNALDDEAEKSGEFQSSSKRQKDIVTDLVNNESQDCQTLPSTLREFSAPDSLHTSVAIEEDNSGYTTPPPRLPTLRERIAPDLRYTFVHPEGNNPGYILLRTDISVPITNNMIEE